MYRAPPTTRLCEAILWYRPEHGNMCWGRVQTLRKLLLVLHDLTL